MKASEIKKDTRASIRVSTLVKEELKKLGLSVQEAFDEFINSKINFEIKQTTKKGKK